MIKVTSARAGMAALAAVLAATSSCVALAQQARSTAVDDSVRLAVDELFTATRFAVEPAEAAFATKRIKLEPFASDLAGCGELGAVRASDQGNLHGAIFVVAIVDRELFRLGGSAAPDVAAFVAAVQRGPRRMDMLGLSRCLARLLDPEAGVRIIALGDSASPASSPSLDSLSRRWLGDRPRSRFADRVVSRPDGGRWVRVSVLSGTDGYGGPTWRWRSYTFLFDRAGELRHWHVRVDDPVQLP